jgi:hypothetical protein
MKALKRLLCAAGAAFAVQGAAAAALFLLLGDLGLFLALGTWPVVFGPVFLTALLCLDAPKKENP